MLINISSLKLDRNQYFKNVTPLFIELIQIPVLCRERIRSAILQPEQPDNNNGQKEK
jgi:hypothetical protein